MAISSVDATSHLVEIKEKDGDDLKTNTTVFEVVPGTNFSHSQFSNNEDKIFPPLSSQNHLNWWCGVCFLVAPKPSPPAIVTEGKENNLTPHLLSRVSHQESKKSSAFENVKFCDAHGPDSWFRKFAMLTLSWRKELNGAPSKELPFSICLTNGNGISLSLLWCARLKILLSNFTSTFVIKIIFCAYTSGFPTTFSPPRLSSPCLIFPSTLGAIVIPTHLGVSWSSHPFVCIGQRTYSRYHYNVYRKPLSNQSCHVDDPICEFVSCW
ncbi:hypothetical protein CMV_013105 [Castanea mollissima]|uniref:Uncharacterized protein n=1 Tax=Castanea mollissima TaxID=60419 RepID=A0A8J4R936_9ROSI|nr:hypothetical protein CMV_013105 [Castanea mollissima]